MPTRYASRNAVTRSLVAISVLLGTQSVSTQAPPSPSRVDDGDLGAELGCDEGRLVTGRAAADDRDPRHSPPCHARNPSSRAVHMLGTLPCNGSVEWPVRRVRVEHGSRADARALPALPAARHRVAQRLAAHLRRRGAWAGTARSPWSCRTRPARSSSRCTTSRPHDTEILDYWEGADTGLYNKIKLRVSTLDGDVLAWVYVLNGYEGGLPSARYLGLIAEAAAGRRGAGRVRRRAARPPLPLPRRMRCQHACPRPDRRVARFEFSGPI